MFWMDHLKALRETENLEIPGGRNSLDIDK